MRRLAILVLCVFVTTVAFVSASGVQDAAQVEVMREDTVIFDLAGSRVSAFELWNPYVPGHRRDQGFHQAVIEPLFMSNLLTGEIEPWLGAEMTPNDTLDSWTLRLQEGVTWSDGEPFSADDVVFTIEMLLDNAPELSYSAAMVDWVAAVTKVDDLTVRFNLTRPNPRFQLDYFAVKIWGSVSIVPKHIWQDQDPLTFTNYDPSRGWPVFTGPYTVTSVSETEFIYDRDEDWWGAKAGFKPLPEPLRLVWIFVGPEETRTALTADDQIDSLHDISLGAFEALQRRNPNVIAWYSEMPYAHIEPTCTRTLEFNTAIEPWSDPTLRWAVNHAIDRAEIVRIAYEGTTVESRHFFPISDPLERLVDMLEDEGLYDEYPVTKHDPDLARELIESRGYSLGNDGYYYKDGQQLQLDIQTHEAYIEKIRWAQVVVEQLQRVGINASARTVAGGTWSENNAFGRYEASAGWQTCGSVSEPWSSLQQFSVQWLTPVGERAPANIWRWSGENAEAYSALVEEMGTLPIGDPRIDDLFLEAMTYWLPDLPVIPTTQARKLTPFVTTYWTGWPTSENRYTSPTTWWQNTHAILHNLERANR